MGLDFKNAMSEKNLKDNSSKKPFKERIIISLTSKWKAIFDVFILFCVGFSCVFSMYHVSFPKGDTKVVLL